jgi:hypothetical protein
VGYHVWAATQGDVLRRWPAQVRKHIKRSCKVDQDTPDGRKLQPVAGQSVEFTLLKAEGPHMPFCSEHLVPFCPLSCTGYPHLDIHVPPPP